MNIKNAKNVFIGINICFMISLMFSCSSVEPPDRDNDFQIHDSYFEKGDFFSIEQMKNQKFISAVKTSDYDRVKVLLESDAVSAKTCDNFHQTALMWACWNSDYEMVKLLLDYQDEYRGNLRWWHKCFLFPWWYYKPVTIDKKNVNDKSDNDYTALFCAAYKGDDQLMKLLLEPDADKGKKKSSPRNAKISERDLDKDGENLLHKMAKSGKASNIRKFLLESDYSIKSNRYKSSWLAMYYGQNKNGYTPFHLAILNNDSQMVRLFLELEKELKVIGKEPIVNIHANLGKQKVYPLYTAYKVRNPNIFQQLLEDKNLNTKIKFPDGIAEHTYDDIGEYFDLEKKGKEVFEKRKNDTSTYKTFDFDVNIFADMFEKRMDWEKNKKAELNVSSDAFNLNKSRLAEIIEFGTKDGIPLSFPEIKKEINKLRNNLYGNLNGNDNGKDLLELAVKNELFSIQEKIYILDWLLDNGDGYSSHDADNDILCFCLSNANSKNQLIEIAEYLITSKWKYKDKYEFQRPGCESYLLVMTNPFIRNNKNPLLPYKSLKDLLDKINFEYRFTNEKVEQNILCAVLAISENNLSIPHSHQKYFPAYAIELFNYFRMQHNYDIFIDGSPLCSWFFEIGFDEGIDEILEDEQLAKKLRINKSLDKNKKKFIELLKENNPDNVQRKQKFENWTDRYYAIFPELNSDSENNANEPKSKKGWFKNKQKGIPTMEPSSNKNN